MHRKLCTDSKRNGASHFDAGLGEKELWAGGAAAKTKLTYSHTSGISRAGPSLDRVIVCIIQVSRNDSCSSSREQGEKRWMGRVTYGSLPTNVRSSPTVGRWSRREGTAK